MAEPQTPPRSGSLPNSDTLVLPKHTSSGAYREGDPDQKRIAVMNDLGSSIPEVAVDFCLESVAPKVDDIDLVRIKQQLLDRGHVHHDRWSGFSEDPARSKLHEPEAFQPLGGVFKSIISCSGLGSSPYLQYYENPYHSPLSSHEDKTRPDGYFARQPTCSSDSNVANGHQWIDIAVSGEYKKKTSDAGINDNVRKVVWDMHHIMRNDPCRRFTFGFTIEDTQMRLWFASRSTVLVTKPFNFMQDRDQLIRFVLSVTYSTPESVGWDPTMCRIYVGTQAHYDITVHALEAGRTVPIVYRTEGILSDLAANALRGRGTRVFKARVLNCDTNEVEGDPVALKDAWVDHNRGREGEIRRRFEDEAAEEDKPLIRQYFMTVLHHGDVLIDNQIDHTRDLIFRHADVPSDYCFTLQMTTSRSEPSTSVESIPMVDTPGRAWTCHASHYHHSAKFHYRIVYQEVAESLYTVKSLTTVLQSLMDGTKALELLSKYGWVHRDVSCGNLLVFNGGGKLSDLEYMKKMNQEGSHETRTGTLDFMSVEVESENYLFLSRVPIAILRNPATAPRVPVFRYNPLHDLESLWWVALWMIFNHRDDQDEVAHSVEKQTRYTRMFFPGVILYGWRSMALQGSRTLYDALGYLPTSLQVAGLGLEVIRRGLVDCYKEAEADTEINQAAFQNIHTLFFSEFEQARDQSGQVQLCPLAGTSTSKRPRSSTASSEQGIESSRAASPTPASKPKKIKIVWNVIPDLARLW